MDVTDGVPAAHHVRPVVHETLTGKTLLFSQKDVQSEMHLLRPFELQFEYTKIMMGFLLHNPQPRRIAMVGLGGGSLAKFCYRYLPQAHITVIEINPYVIAHRDAFSVPPDDDRFTVIQADAAHWIQQTEQRFDVLLADGFDIEGLPEALSSPQYYDGCFQVLQPGGMLVANLHGCHPNVEVFLDRIQASFRASVLTVQDPSATNRVAFAVKDDAYAFSAITSTRRPAHMDPHAWQDLLPSMARLFLACRQLARQD